MIETKICIKCGVEKPLSEYPRFTSGKGGIRNTCRDCINEQRRWRTANDPEFRDRVNRSKQKYRAENREHYLKLARESRERRYQENPELRQKALEDAKRVYQNRSDEQKQKYLEQQRLWNKDPDVIKRKAEQCKKNYHENRQYFIDKLGGQCVSCGTTDNLEFDHINPLDKSFGVSSRLSRKNAYQLDEELIEEINKCQLLCQQCHSKKTHGPDRPLINQKLNKNRDC